MYDASNYLQRGRIASGSKSNGKKKTCSATKLRLGFKKAIDQVRESAHLATYYTKRKNKSTQIKEKQ